MGETHIIVPENNNWLGSIMGFERRETMSQQQGPRIPRVPQIFSGIKSNKKCYEPMVVSIGPYYRGKLDDSHGMEKFKVKMVCTFVQQSGKLIEEFYNTVVGVAEQARRCYDEDGSFQISDMTEFTNMLFLDGCFVIQFMHCLLDDHENLKLTSHVAALVARDMLLLENQLPFLVLRPLMKLRFGDKGGAKLSKDFIKHIRAMPRQRDSFSKKMSKFFRKTILLGELNTLNDTATEEYFRASHLLELFHMHFAHKDAPVDHSSMTRLYRYHPAMELRRVGIHFNPSKTSQLTDVQFKPTWLGGRLQIPPLTIDDSTESLLLNLVAYEACLGDNDKLWVITSYICFMDSLIDHPEDVRVLRSQGILLVTLGSEDEVAKLFNETAKYLVPNPLVLNKVKKDIESHYRSTMKRWAAKYLDTYFSRPWSFITFVAASLTIALTAIQSYFVLFPLNNNCDCGKY